MRLEIELAGRYLSLQIGDVADLEETVVVIDEEESEVPDLISLPMGFQAPSEEDTDNDEEPDEAPEVDCC